MAIFSSTYRFRSLIRATFWRQIGYLIYPTTVLFQFIHHVSKRFVADRCTYTAAALTYTSLLALVPLLATGFSILAAFPVFETVTDEIQDFIFANFVPASQEMIQDYLLRFAEQASHLTAIGIVFLLVTALLLMETIDYAFNEIWGVQQRRRGISIFMVYWAVLSLGPLLLGVSLVVTSYFISLPVISDMAHTLGVKPFLLRMMPFSLTTLAFTLIYIAVPNRRVFLHHAFMGGFLAALLFEMAKRGFAYYVTQLATYKIVYGALSAVPIFLLWIYLSWIIILLGAEITRSFVSFYREHEQTQPCLPRQALLNAFRILGHLWQAQRHGKMLTLYELAKLESQSSDINIELLLNHLEKVHWIHRSDGGYYALTRDMHEMTVLDLYHAISGVLLEPIAHYQKETPAHDNLWNQALKQKLTQTKHSLDKTLNIPLVQLFNGKW